MKNWRVLRAEGTGTAAKVRRSSGGVRIRGVGTLIWKEFTAGSWPLEKSWEAPTGPKAGWLRTESTGLPNALVNEIVGTPGPPGRPKQVEG